MVKSATVDAVLSYLKPYSNYSIWAAALTALRSQVEASDAEQVLFAASDNQSCRLQGWSSGGFWASRDSLSFLCQIIVLPRGWPNIPVRYYECDTLAVDFYTNAIISLFMRVSPQSFILPTGDAVAFCDIAIPRPCGSALALRSSFLDLAPPLSPLSQAIAAMMPELSYFTQWMITAGLGALAAAPGTYTLLAPTNYAFEVFAASIGTTAAAFVSDPARVHMASYHIAAGTFGPLAVDSAPPPNAVASDGFLLTFQCSTCFYVNSAIIDVPASKVASNGILYVIGSVLGHGISGPYP